MEVQYKGTKRKEEILEEIKKLYRIKPYTAVFIVIFIVFVVMLITGQVGNFASQLDSDFIGAIINLLFALNVGFGLYQGIWQFWNSRKINKVLFPKLEQFIKQSEDKSYDEIEAEVYEMVKSAYSGYTARYNLLNKIYWLSMKISLIFLFVFFFIWSVLQLL